MTRRAAILAGLLLVGSEVAAQQPDSSGIDVHIMVRMADQTAHPQVLLRGAPFDVAVSLGYDPAAARKAQLQAAWDLAMAQQVRDGKPLVTPPMPPLVESLRLPVDGAGWIEDLTVDVEQLDAGGVPEVVIESARVRAALLAGWRPPSHESELSRRTSPCASGELPASLFDGLAAGNYRVTAAFDTRASTEPGVWKGRVEATLGPLELRNPVTPRERCDVAWRCFEWSVGHKESVAARQVFVEAILATDESYDNFKAWAVLGDLREEQGDASGARHSWQQYVDKAAWPPPTIDDLTGYRVREKLGLPIR